MEYRIRIEKRGEGQREVWGGKNGGQVTREYIKMMLCEKTVSKKTRDVIVPQCQ